MTTGRNGQIDVFALIDHFVLGGAETLLARFAALASYGGIRLQTACLQDLDGNPAAEPLRQLGIAPVNLNLVGRPSLSTLQVLRDHIRSTGAQIIHTHLGTSDVLGGVAARSLAIPAVSTIHTTLWRGSRVEMERRLVGFCSDRIIAVSDSAREEYLRRGWATERQIVTVYNGVDITVEPNGGARVRRELGLDPEDQVAIMLSALRPEKAHDVVVDAVQRLRGRFPRLRLLIVGQGDLRDHLARRAAASEGSVILAGLRTDVGNVMSAADICVHPSQREALPTTLLEAMAACVPVVATAVGGIPEIVSDGRDGVLVPAPATADAVAAAMGHLLEDREERLRLASAGRAVYEARFTSQLWIDNTRRVYDDILARRASLQRRATVIPAAAWRAVDTWLR
jgi:glycosyltransferase involved in cell wall biosynthesis